MIQSVVLHPLTCTFFGVLVLPPFYDTLSLCRTVDGPLCVLFYIMYSLHLRGAGSLSPKKQK